MAHKKNFDNQESPKAHVDQPPAEIAPHEDQPEHPRGPVAQYTDKGAPSLQKR